MCLAYTWFCKLSIAKVTVYYLSPQSLQSGFQTKELLVINKYGSCQISLCFVKPLGLFQIIKVPPPHAEDNWFFWRWVFPISRNFPLYFTDTPRNMLLSFNFRTRRTFSIKEGRLSVEKPKAKLGNKRLNIFQSFVKLNKALNSSTPINAFLLLFFWFLWNCCIILIW